MHDCLPIGTIPNHVHPHVGFQQPQRGSRVDGLGLRVYGRWFRFRVQGAGCRV